LSCSRACCHMWRILVSAATLAGCDFEHHVP
jgi:hypothetical protein